MFMSNRVDDHNWSLVIIDWFQCLDASDVWTPEKFICTDGKESYLRKTSDDLTSNPKYDGNILVVHGAFSMCGGQLFVNQGRLYYAINKRVSDWVGVARR